MLQVERYFRQSRNKLNMFHIVALFGNEVECYFDKVAGVDGALEWPTTARTLGE